jgi:hypothetical protein
VLKRCLSYAFGALLLVSAPAVAGLKDIRTENLPHDPGVQKAYDGTLLIEEMVRDWNEKWPYETPKDEVVSSLRASLAALQKASEAAPDNEELLLLIGLVAQYAYNVDIEGSHELTTHSLEKARKLAPEDIRPEWFLAKLQCHTLSTKEGMESFLTVERRLPWERLPVSFWDDYLFCNAVTNMPAHGLRAADHIKRLNAPPSPYRDALVDISRKRLRTPDLKATYSSAEAWRVTTVDSKPVFTSFLCGFSFSSPGEWRLDLPDVQKGQCSIQIEIGPYASQAGNVTPNILVLVRQAKPGETLEDFQMALLRNTSLKPAKTPFCSSQECLTSEAVEPGLYREAGDGHVIVTVFRREAPAFPGIPFEELMALPSIEKDKTTYLRSPERLTRLEGTLYYLVLLDSASSVLEKAKSEYAEFLKGFTAE